MRLPPPGPARATLLVAGWVALATAAVLIGVAALGALGSGILGSASEPWSADRVDDALAQVGATTSVATATTPSPVATSTPATTAPGTAAASPGSAQPPPATIAPPPQTQPAQPPATSEPPAAQTKTVNTRGGTVVARCSGGPPQIVSAVPAQDYHVEVTDHGDRKRVEFESDEDRVRVEVSCNGMTPVFEIDD